MSQPSPRIVAVFGPTGSGKTDVAVRVAHELGTDVVNCDPAQCYRGFPLLTNQPGREHEAIAAHRLVGCWGLDVQASAAAFSERAHAAIDELVAERGSAVLCGGSGLYMRAAISALEWGGAGEQADRDGGLRARLHAAYARLGGQALHEQLATRDPVVAARVDLRDEKRLVRALEAAVLEGSVSPAGRSLWDAPVRMEGTACCWLQVDRPLIRERIERRTHAMFNAGLLEEVERLLGPRAEGYELLSRTAQRLHGLDDCVRVLRGEISDAAGRERMITRTRQYAKRQDTWARRWPGLIAVPVDLASFDPTRTGTLLLARARAQVSTAPLAPEAPLD